MNYEPTFDKIIRKSKEQPWVPLGVALTVGSFIGAYIKFRQGSRAKGVEMLRYRVAFQGLTVVGLLLGSMITMSENTVKKPIKVKSAFEKLDEEK